MTNTELLKECIQTIQLHHIKQLREQGADDAQIENFFATMPQDKKLAFAKDCKALFDMTVGLLEA